jgi:hypothetical protein
LRQGKTNRQVPGSSIRFRKGAGRESSGAGVIGGLLQRAAQVVDSVVGMARIDDLEDHVVAGFELATTASN